MHIGQIDEAARIASRMKDAKQHREKWAKVDIATTVDAARALERYTDLPDLSVDPEMHSTIVQAIINEYDGRIAAAKRELETLGVTTE